MRSNRPRTPGWKGRAGNGTAATRREYRARETGGRGSTGRCFSGTALGRRSMGTSAIGKAVPVEAVQPVVNELLAANLVMRQGHGVDLVTDPFVQEMWRATCSRAVSKRACALEAVLRNPA